MASSANILQPKSHLYAQLKDGLPFCSKSAVIMHLDLNSCFATIEQQANPKLRNKPVAVAAYASPGGCILAASYDAKRLGVKTGMRVREGRLLCPNLIVLSPDPNKYRTVHHRLKMLLNEYTDVVIPKSIDEFVLDFTRSPYLKSGMESIAGEVKQRIKSDIGEWLTVSVGIAPNRYLAKIGAGLKKPDGLNVISQSNFLEVYEKLQLTDLTGIKRRNALRLNRLGMYTVLDFYNAQAALLRQAFSSVVGFWWYLRLRGWEIDDVEWGRRSYGNSFALPQPLMTAYELAPILQKLVEKMGFRLRKAGYKARGVHLAISYRNGEFWHHGHSFSEVLFDSRDIYKIAHSLLLSSPLDKTVAILAVSVFNLQRDTVCQLSLFEDLMKKERVVEAVDEINKEWGNFVVTPAHMLGTEKLVPDRIAFGGVKELEEIVIGW